MTANDSDVSDGDTLTGSQVVRVYGENLTAPFVTLTFGDVEYTPLIRGDGYIEYILGDNGVATINVDGRYFMSFEVEGIVVPSIVPTNFGAFQKSDTSIYAEEGTVINNTTIRDVNCINYTEVVNENFPNFLFFIVSEGDLSVELGFYNCTLNLSGYVSPTSRLNVSVINPNEVAYITYQGFIIAVFNYTTD